MRHSITLLFSLFYIFNLAAQPQGWLAGIGSDGYDTSPDIEVDFYGNSYIIGEFEGTMDCDPGDDEYTITSFLSLDIFIIKLDALGKFVWAKKIGYNFDDGGEAISVDKWGNVYAIGYFRNTVDFDPGPGVFNLVSDGYQDYFILKLNSAGDFQWAKAIVGDGSANNKAHIEVGDDDQIYTAGMFGGVLDFDPGPGVYELTGESYDVFIAKYDLNGNFLWAGDIGGTSTDYVHSIFVNDLNEVFVCGTFILTSDFDIGPGTFNLTSAGGPDLFLLKLNADGNFQWVKQIGSAGNDFGLSAQQDEMHNIFVTGGYDGTTDFDPGPGVMNFTSVGDNDIFIIKLDENGDLIWGQTYGSPGEDIATALHVDQYSNVYFGGEFSGAIDFDYGPGLQIIDTSLIYAISAFTLKLNEDGNFIWVWKLEGEYNVEIWDIQVHRQNVYMTGKFFGALSLVTNSDSLWVDGVDEQDCFITKYKQDSCSDFTVLIDTVVDVTCATGTGSAVAYTLGGNSPFDYTWNTIPPIIDSTGVFNSVGIYNVQVTDDVGCNVSTSVLIEGPLFPIDADVAISITSTDFQAGTDAVIWPEVINWGCVPLSGNYEVILDTALNYNSASPPPDFIDGDTLIWDFEDLIFETFTKKPVISVTPSVYLFAGDTIKIQGIVNAPEDLEEENNSVTHNEVVIASFDPNDKQVSPLGLCDAGYILDGEKLTYTIRFQNTGTANAINIVVMDTLSEFVNINSLNSVSSSHFVITELLPGNILKFSFNNIYLPDSNSNEPESHGYISYKISPLPGFFDVAINNSAGIFFDYNYPIITNTVTNTVVDVLPVMDLTQYISICEGEFIEVGGIVHDAAGVYVDVLESVLGCDSVVTTYLTTNPVYEESNNYIICEGEEIIVDGNIYTEAGTYIDELISLSGCDSIITTNIVVNPAYFETISASICKDESYLFGDTIIETAGIYLQDLVSANGCDSIVELTLVVNYLDNTVSLADDQLIANLDGVEYQWLDCDNGNSVIPGEDQQTFIADVTGNYSVILNDGLCIDTSECYFIEVEDVGINEMIPDIEIYPNPVNDFIHLSLINTSGTSRLHILNMEGKVVYQKSEIENGITIVNINELSSGLYIAEVSGSSMVLRKYFVIIR